MERFRPANSTSFHRVLPIGKPKNLIGRRSRRHWLIQEVSSAVLQPSWDCRGRHCTGAWSASALPKAAVRDGRPERFAPIDPLRLECEPCTPEEEIVGVAALFLPRNQRMITARC